jgi:hypothetical protein
VNAPLLNPKPLCASLEPLDTEFGRKLKADNDYPFLFKKGEAEYVAIDRLLFHWTLIVGDVDDYWGYKDRYCYQDLTLALYAAAEWADRGFEGEPLGWHRHPKSGRRRPEGDPSREHVAP